MTMSKPQLGKNSEIVRSQRIKKGLSPWSLEHRHRR